MIWTNNEASNYIDDMIIVSPSQSRKTNWLSATIKFTQFMMQSSIAH